MELLGPDISKYLALENLFSICHFSLNQLVYLILKKKKKNSNECHSLKKLSLWSPAYSPSIQELRREDQLSLRV